MKAERASTTSSSFEFIKYESGKNDSCTAYPDLCVTRNAFWSYCGPLLAEAQDLPPTFHEWASAGLSGSLLPLLMPFLEFANGVLREHELDHYWLTIRATKATREFDEPRWHTDDMFFSARGGGLRTIPRENEDEDEGEGSGSGSGRTLDLQTDWKLCTTLLGPSTMFIPPRHQAEARGTQQSARRALSTDHECTSIRCVACAATADAVREKLSRDLERLGAVQCTPGECVFFHIGQEKGAVHSEPPMGGGDRVFVNVVPGKRGELEKLMAKWGMDFPRSWWIAPNVPRG
ncbi:hypothetical protein F5Y14DRAFT_319130 [Nemania sp. NC0429]|nr:hypothetical protein F5Y14DRAFT_319130 [Nemania sp. NC0429]